MGSDAAELSSIATSLDDLCSRVSRMAEDRTADAEPDEVASGLFEVERSLREARRRLDRIGQTLAS